MNENLFWKVIHNKYIFNEIFKQIKSSELEYQDIEKYYIGNRISFKDIQSLNFLANKKQWSILKDKIETNQYIYYNKESIQLFFKQCSSKKLIQQFIEYQIKLKKYQQLLVMIDLIEICLIENCKEKILKYLINDLSLAINDNVVELVLSSKSLNIVKIIINSKQFKINDSIKMNCLKYISKNNKNENVIQYILFIRPELNYYSSKILVDRMVTLTSGSGGIVSDLFLVSTFFNLQSIELQKKLLEIGCVNRTSTSDLLNIILPPNSNSIRNLLNSRDTSNNMIENLIFLIEKLISICIDINENCSSSSSNIKRIIQEIENSNKNNNNEIKIQKLKELILEKLLLKNVPPKCYYIDYLNQYDCIFSTILNDYDTIYEYTFSTVSLKGLKYLNKNSKKSNIKSYNNNNNATFEKNVILVKTDKIFEKELNILTFLKEYFKHSNEFNFLIHSEIYLIKLFSFILLNYSISTLDEVFKLISKSPNIRSCLLFCLEYKNGLILKEMVEINNDIQRYDWIIQKIILLQIPITLHSDNNNNNNNNNSSNNSIWNFKIDSKSKIDFLIENQNEFYNIKNQILEIENLELLNYISKSKPLPNHCIHLYWKSLINNDFKTVEEIDKFNLKLNLNLITPQSLSNYLNGGISRGSSNNIKEMINYLNNISKFKSFSNDSIYEFIKINYQFLIISNNYEIKFNLFPNISMKLLYQKIINLEFQAVNQIIDCLIQNDQFNIELLILAIEEYGYIKFNLLDDGETIGSNQGSNWLINLKKFNIDFKNVLIPFIKSLFKKLQSTTNVKISEFKHINLLFTFLYKILLQCKFENNEITLDLVQHVREFYNSNDLQIKDDYFNLCCYLFIKSNLFLKYIYSTNYKLLLPTLHIDFKYNNTTTPTTTTTSSIVKFESNLTFYEIYNQIEFNNIIRIIQKQHNFNNDEKSLILEIRTLLELNKVDMVLELLSDTNILAPPPPLIEYGPAIIKLANLDQFKHFLEIMLKPSISDNDKCLILEYSIINSKYEFIDHLIDGIDLFDDVDGVFNLGNIQKIESLFLDNDYQIFEYLVKNFRGVSSSPTSIDLFSNFNSFKINGNNALYTCFCNGLVDFCDLILRHFTLIIDKDMVIKAVSLKQYSIVNYYYRNGGLSHLGQNLISNINEKEKRKVIY